MEVETTVDTKLCIVETCGKDTMCNTCGACAKHCWCKELQTVEAFETFIDNEPLD
jgi:DTW domain-containing protein YfiP